MNVLAIDTASACSVVLARDGHIVARRHAEIARGHAEALMPMIESVLEEAHLDYEDLDLIAAAVGPGSFTGLRTGLACARGLALALGKPTRGVSSLEAVATAADCGTAILVALETKRADIYIQAFDSTLAPLTPPSVARIEDVAALAPKGPFAVAGDAAHRLRGHIAARFIDDVRPGDAAVIAAIAARRGPPAAPDVLRPLYLAPPLAVPAA